MGAKARFKFVPPAPRDHISAEMATLVQVLDILDHTVKSIPVPTRAQEQLHRAYLRHYLESRDSFTGQRNHVLDLARHNQYQVLDEAFRVLDDLEAEYTKAHDTLVAFRRQLEDAK